MHLMYTLSGIPWNNLVGIRDVFVSSPSLLPSKAILARVHEMWGEWEWGFWIHKQHIS